MERRFAYWAELISEGLASRTGRSWTRPGTYRIAGLEIGDGAAPQAVAEDDPAIRADADCRFDLYPKVDAVVRALTSDRTITPGRQVVG
jgi:hypothetical protein